MLKSFNHILGTIQNQPQWQEYKQFQQLLKCWSEVVGATVGQQTRPYSISRDVLYVATSSSVWAQELIFKRRLILKKLNAQLSSSLADIHFSTAQWQNDFSTGDAASKPQPSSWQEHPSHVAEAEYASPSTQTTLHRDAQTAFQYWAEVIQARSLSLPLCPQCQCPTPPGELDRWNICGLCAAKQWQG
jgi:predicted nucleic acid-binding Zn ribbon protein